MTAASPSLCNREVGTLAPRPWCWWRTTTCRICCYPQRAVRQPPQPDGGEGGSVSSTMALSSPPGGTLLAGADRAAAGPFTRSDGERCLTISAADGAAPTVVHGDLRFTPRAWNVLRQVRGTAPEAAATPSLCSIGPQVVGTTMGKRHTVRTWPSMPRPYGVGTAAGIHRPPPSGPLRDRVTAPWRVGVRHNGGEAETSLGLWWWALSSPGGLQSVAAGRSQ
ncbi:MAG: hypothetical protein F4226_03160 [Synechococcus sp. SB0678_bin_12]|nr:hypothetical protein [Synechococcus sp. SB0678_bin_12]